jgi:hypothetical protein
MTKTKKLFCLIWVKYYSSGKGCYGYYKNCKFFAGLKHVDLTIVAKCSNKLLSKKSFHFHSWKMHILNRFFPIKFSIIHSILARTLHLQNLLKISGYFHILTYLKKKKCHLIRSLKAYFKATTVPIFHLKVIFITFFLSRQVF